MWHWSGNTPSWGIVKHNSYKEKIMKFHMTFYSIMIALCFLLTAALANVPHQINFQGTLTDSLGNPLNGIVDYMEFNFYSDSTGGMILWGVGQYGVEVNDGLYQVLLPTMPQLFDGNIVWLDIRVGTPPEHLYPRIPFLTVPYAYMAEKADQATYADTADYAVSGASDNDWELSGDDIYRETGNVGIGATAPETRLHVEGTVTVDQKIMADDNGGLELATDDGTTRFFIADNGNVGVGTGTTQPSAKLDVIGDRLRLADSTPSPTKQMNLRLDGAGVDIEVEGGGLFINSITDNTFIQPWGGNVGIGTTHPNDVLDVNGFMRIGDHAGGGAALRITDANELKWALLYRPWVDSSLTIVDDRNAIDVMTFQRATGNVGIGATAPETKLHVEGTVTVDQKIMADDNGGLELATDEGTTRLKINDNGNVGIGVSNPGYKLHVEGQGISGFGSIASGSYSTVSGGGNNTASAQFSTVAGGTNNVASGLYSTVGGGFYNKARGTNSVVAGGGGIMEVDSNSVVGDYSAILGGKHNSCSGDYATIGGGILNYAEGMYSAVPGGRDNIAQGEHSVAMGRHAQALHDGSFVWSDGSGFATSTTDTNQFLIQATGGVGIGTESPAHQLDVHGDRIQLSEDGTGDWIAMRTDGSLLDFSFAGANLAIKSDVAGEHVLINPASTNFLGVGTWVPEERLHVNGRIYVSTMDATAGGLAVRWYNNRLYYQSSSRKYKEDIQPLGDDCSKILQADPVSFTDKVSGERCIGFIAEEFEKLGLKDLVVHRDGEPDGVKYELVSLYLLEIIKNQNAKIEELTKRIDSIEKAAN
jgi:hypothetical protein